MDLDAFLRDRRPAWRRLEDTLARVEGSGLGSLDDDQAEEFGQLYRRACSDLNQAQTYVSGDATVQHLNGLVARCYLVLYSKSRVDVIGFLRYLLWGYPAVFRRHAGALLLATALFTAGALLGFLASWCDAEAARGYLLPADFPMIQPQSAEDKAAQEPLTTGELQAFSSQLFTNNVSVSLVAFALGITLGIGTAWLMLYNGLLLGVLAAIFMEAGEWTSFCTGVLPHGVIEIPACLIGGAAGFVLAWGLIPARVVPRRLALAESGKRALYLVAGCIPLLAAAAILEAGVARAPDWVFGSGVKLAAAGVVFLAFVSYVLLAGRSTHAP